MDLGIAGKLALVTAATKGLGRACAEALAAEGCRVAICARTAEDVKRVAREIASVTDSEVVGFVADMSQAADIDRLVQQVRQKLGEIDILVTNAGGPPPGTYADMTLDQYPKAFELSAMSAIRLVHAVTDAMKVKHWGRIVMITSITVKQPIDTLLLSNMARAGLTGFMKTVATELAPYGVTVNAVLPGLHETHRLRQVAAKKGQTEGISTDDALAAMGKTVPAGRLGQPEQLGAMVAFLASQRAAYVTGTNVLVDGGAYKGLL